ncbi:MAG: ABC transporter substrate-binding protein [Chloroflexota bacterium]
MIKRTLFTLSTIAILIALAACGSQEAAVQDVTVMLDWTPNTNHTGLYVALEQGLYAENGLNVEIVQPGEADVHQAVATNSAQFGVSYQEGTTFARAAEVPVVSVAAVIQHNTSGFAARSTVGLSSPTDFAGKKYGSFSSPIEAPMIDLLMQCEGGSVDSVEFIDIGWSEFLPVTEQGDVDFAWIFYGWTGIAAELQGVPIDIVMLKDYTDCVPDYYTPILITSESLIADDPDLVTAFVNATARGYEYAIENPEEAADILVAAAPELDQELVLESQKWLANEYQAEAAQWGVQSTDIWQNYADWLQEQGVLEEEFSGEMAFTNDFLP